MDAVIKVNNQKVFTECTIVENCIPGLCKKGLSCEPITAECVGLDMSALVLMGTILVGLTIKVMRWTEKK